MDKNITSLRNHLFDALNRLAEATEQDIDLEVNKSVHIVNVAQVIIKTAEVENQFIAITKGVGSGFIPLLDSDKQKQNGGISFSDNSPKLFDVDSQKNWLSDSGTTPQP